MNINDRNIKYPHFTFTFSAAGGGSSSSCETAKTLNSVSLSGEDARTIIADPYEVVIDFTKVLEYIYYFTYKII